MNSSVTGSDPAALPTILSTLRDYMLEDLEHIQRRQRMIDALLSQHINLTSKDAAATEEHGHGHLERLKSSIAPLGVSSDGQTAMHQAMNQPSTDARTQDDLEDLFDSSKRLHDEARVLTLKYHTSLADLRRRVHVSRTIHFPHFTRLPPELRIAVWKFSLFRVYNVFRPTRIVPAIAHACSESRAVCLQLLSLESNSTSRDPAMPEYHPWTFLDPSSTVVYLSRNYRDWQWRFTEPSTQRAIEVAIKAPQLLLDASWEPFSDLCRPGLPRLATETSPLPRGHPWAYIYNFSNIAALPPPTYLHKIINLNIGEASQVDPSWGRPDLVWDLFRGDRFLIVDLQNRSQVRHVAHILRRFQQHWTAIGGIQLCTAMTSQAQNAILSIDKEVYWTHWDYMIKNMVKGFARELTQKWIPVTGTLDVEESEFEDFVEGDTQSVQEVVVDILADTTFRLVHVMENAGGLPRELSLEPPDPSPVRRRTRILRQRPRPPPQQG